MLILDTTVLSVLEWAGSSAQAQRWVEKLQQSGEEAFTTVVSCEEQMRGWMASLARKPDVKNQIEAYRRLRSRIESYCKMRILDFDELAATKYQALRREKVRIGTMDMKIAAIALAHDSTVLTENVRDFAQVPGLKVEDWSKS